MVDRPRAPNERAYRSACRAGELLEAQAYREAELEYSKAVTEAHMAECDDFLALMLLNKSVAHGGQQQWKEAEADARAAVQLMPTSAKAHFRLGEALLRLEQWTEACTCLAQANALRPKDHIMMDMLAEALIHRDNALMGLAIHKLVPGRDMCLEKSSVNLIQRKIRDIAIEMKNIVYVVADVQSRQCVVVDACWDIEATQRLIETRGYILKDAIITHAHFDHVGGHPPPPYNSIPVQVSGIATLLKSLPQLPVYIHSADIPALRSLNPKIPIGQLHTVDPDYVLQIGNTALQFIHTPGHTAGSQCILINNTRLLSGDTLFPNKCGRTDLPGGSRSQLHVTLRNKLGSLDDRVVVLPGHYYSRTWSTIGIERELGWVGEDLVGFGYTMRGSVKSNSALQTLA